MKDRNSLSIHVHINAV